MKNYFEDHTSRSIGQLISLKDKGSVVTGGADGIGAGIVRRLAEAGSSVVVADIDIKKAEKTSSTIAASTAKKFSDKVWLSLHAKLMLRILNHCLKLQRFVWKILGV